MIQNKRILVAGGGGFIGSHLAKRLYDEGNFVRVADIDFTKPIGFNGKWFTESKTLDLRKPENAQEACKDIDIVFQLAADVGGMGYITEQRADLMRDNQMINLSLLDAASTNKAERFFFSSSACAYPYTLQDELDAKPLKETDISPAQPDSFYGWEKLMMEKECAAYHIEKGLETRVARFFSIYGPGCAYDDYKGKAPATLMRKALESTDNNIVIWGDGKAQRSFLYVDDCVEGIIKITESDISDPINLGTNELMSVDGVVDVVEKLTEKKLIRNYDLSKPQGVRSRSVDNTLAKTKLGWEPKYTFAQGEELTYQWLRPRVVR